MGIMHERIEASMPVLEVKSLSVSYRTAAGPVCAVRDFSVELAAGESLAIVGETGSGKSTVALALMGLLPGTARVEADRLRFLGEALLLLVGRGPERAVFGVVFTGATPVVLRNEANVPRHGDELRSGNVGRSRPHRARDVWREGVNLKAFRDLEACTLG